MLKLALIHASTAQATRDFFFNVWPMYVHELNGLGSACYQLDAAGRWQPNVASQWVASITPNVNLREDRSALDPQQPFQRVHVVLKDDKPIGFVCVGVRPLRYMPEAVDHCIAELFITHAERGQGVSQAAVAAVLAAYPPGRWYLEALQGNPRAQRFWSKVLPAVGATSIERDVGAHTVSWRFDFRHK